MLRRILEIQQLWSSDVRLAFMGTLVYMTIAHRRDWFEPGLKRSALDTNQIDRFADELTLCLGLVEDLDLNTRIWSKQ